MHTIDVPMVTGLIESICEVLKITLNEVNFFYAALDQIRG